MRSRRQPALGVALAGVVAGCLVVAAVGAVPVGAAGARKGAPGGRGGVTGAPRGGLFIPGPGSGPGSPTALVPAVARVETKHLTSLNWAGYVESATSGTFTAVTDTWTVPVVAKQSGNKYASDWVGIGGYASGDTTLVQAGTEADFIKKKAFYEAWTEILPATEVPLTMTVSPGDSITSLVEEMAANTWLMQITDNTTGVTQSRTATYASSGSSAEVIHERPCLSPCASAKNLANLAATSNVTFVPGAYSIAAVGTPLSPQPIASALSSTTLVELTMIKTKKKILATPSDPSTANDGFAVADGATAPPPPAT